MAIFKFGNAMPSYESIQNLFDIDSLTLTQDTANQAVFEDSNGFSIVLIGFGLKYAGGAITGGTVTALNFLDDADDVLLNVTDGNYKAAKLTAEFEGNDDLWSFLNLLTAGNDKIYGNNKGTSLGIAEDHGNDKIFCGKGGSYVAGSQGNDTINGGKNWDTLSFEETYWRRDALWGIILDAANGTVTDSWRDKDEFSGIEEFAGSIFGDRMTGSKRDEAFMGLGGKDTIDGGKGWDDIRYQRDDEYEGDAGIDVNLLEGFVIDGFGNKDKVSNIEGVVGTLHNDTFVGSNGDDQFRGLAGKDKFDGGKGSDRVEFQYWDDLGQTGVIVDLSLNSGQIIDDGFGNKETTKSIEVVGGSQFDDQIKLGKVGGWVWGDDGNDVLEGGEDGDDWQSFGGGEGADTFLFASLDALGNKDNRDQIEDFSQDDGDLIDLSGIGGLFFGGKGALTGVAGEVRYFKTQDGTTVISGDTDGNGTANFQLQLNQEVDLEAADFDLVI